MVLSIEFFCIMLCCNVVIIIIGLIVELGLNMLVMVWLCIVFFGVLFRLLGLYDGLLVIVSILLVLIFISMVLLDLALLKAIVLFSL